ncbi:MAG: M48 family metallopeptidase [Desulfuromonadales bacterium]
MKFTPKNIEENVNVSKTHPLVEFGWLLGGLLLLVLILYLLLGVATDIAVAKIPVSVEVWLGEHFVDRMDALENEPLQRIIQPLLDNLPADSPLREYDFYVQMVDNEQINALALPGGQIVVFSGLVEQAESENEVAMVLAHELGHFAHRDHLRRLGRGLGLTVAAIVLFGEDSAVSNLASKFFLVGESHYSREQESAADRFGLELLVAGYGHAGGATDFFARVGKDAGSRIPYLLASHPHPGDRVRELQGLIVAHGYRVDAVIPLGQDLLEDLSANKGSQGMEPASTAGRQASRF